MFAASLSVALSMRSRVFFGIGDDQQSSASQILVLGLDRVEFGLRVDDIDQVTASRSALIDGWGMHWIPGRGWTFNLWGFDCVELIVSGKPLRIGTDDMENLVAFLESKRTS